MGSVDIKNLIRSRSAVDKELGRQLAQLEKKAGGSVNLKIDTPQEQRIVLQSMNGELLSRFKNLVETGSTKNRAAGHGIEGPLFERSFRKSLAFRDAALGLHKQKSALAKDNKIITASRAFQISPGVCSYTVEYRAQRSGEAAMTYGRVSDGGILPGSARREAEAAMNDEAKRLKDIGFKIVSCRVFSLGAESGGLYSYEIRNLWGSREQRRQGSFWS